MKSTKELLLLYAGLFEEVFDKDETLMHEDNFEDYRNVIMELRKETVDFSYGRGYIDKIKAIQNELPFE